VLRVSVSAAGSVAEIATLDGTEPLASALRTAVASWRFEPALEANKAIASHVLVAAVYRPPALYNTPGFHAARPVDSDPALASPKRSERGPDRAPVPTTMEAPAFPVNALGDGVALVELLVDVDGNVRAAAIAQSSGSGFNASALDAARRWQFRPATREGDPVEGFAYVLFGFRQPVTLGTAGRR
jgi:TonB family protein